MDQVLKHTPGPWHVGGPTGYVNQVSIEPTIGVAFGATDAAANARLMAASPELLEALQVAMAAVQVFHGPVAWETYRDHSPEMKRWRAAIAKATGSVT